MPQKTKVESMQVPEISVSMGEVVAVGATPLLCHRMGVIEKGPRNRLTQEEEFQAALYPYSVNGKKTYGFPVGRAMLPILAKAVGLSKGSSIPRTMTMGKIKGAVQVECNNGEGLLPIISKSGPQMDIQPVRVMQARIMRVRARFDDWKIVIPFSYTPSLVAFDMLVHLLQVAGHSVGFGDYNPAHGGSYGRFTLEEVRKIKE